MTRTDSRFPHHRLDAYRVALELFAGAEELARDLPRGHAELRGQLRRAAAAVVRHIAEGANRTHAKDKAARFAVARGECGECDSTLEMIDLLGLAEPGRLARLRNLTDRTAAMLCGLIRRQNAPSAPLP